MYCYLLLVLWRFAVSCIHTQFLFGTKTFVSSLQVQEIFYSRKERQCFDITIKITDYQLFSCIGRPLACSAIVVSISTFLFVHFKNQISKFFWTIFFWNKKHENKVRKSGWLFWFRYVFSCIKSCRLTKRFQELIM